MTLILNGTDSSATTPAVTGGTGGTGTGVYYPASNQVALSTNGTQAITVDTSQNVGIGTNNPSGFSSLLAVRNDTGTCASFNSTGSAKINFQNIGTDSFAIAMPTGTGALAFYSSGTTERMRIDSSGNLLVGTTSTTLSGTGGYWESGGRINLGKTGASTYMAFYVSGTIVGSISTNGTVTSYNISSDYRLKENIAPMTGALAVVSALKPVTYKWKADGSDGQGFIAHELAEIVPDCVTGEKDAVDEEGKPQYQGIDTSFLVATLTAAIQEQQTLIESLTTRLMALENK